VLNGKELIVANPGTPNMGPNAVAAIHDAGGETIVNAKVGVRFGFGRTDATGFLSHSDLAVSYGRALTGTVWYKEIVRVEYRLLF
jgi:hypothetical protein